MSNARVKYFLTLIILFAPVLTCFGQTAKKSISEADSLRQALIQRTEYLQRKEKEVTCLKYLLVAKEMALRSTELQDSIFQALAAVQAYKFNKTYGGNPSYIDVYRALYKALERLGDPFVKTASINIDRRDKTFSEKTATMANKLCSKIKRSMTIEEWNKFAEDLMYEQTCTAAQ